MAEPTTTISTTQLLLLIGSCGAGIVGKIIFDWLKVGRNNGTRGMLQDIQEDTKWLKEAHDQHDGEGRPLWWPPMECKVSMPKILQELETSHDLLTQINASLKLQNELLSKILTAQKEK